MMKVLHITTSGPDAGGVSQYIKRLSYGLVESGCEVTIAGRIPENSVEHCAFTWIEAKTDFGPLGLWQAGNQLAAAGSFDIVHTHYRKASLVGRQVARKQKIPVLFTLHLTGIPMDILHRAISDFGDTTHAPSKQAKEWLIEKCLYTRKTGGLHSARD